jgi:thiamine-phosphate pyrophosphorylase
MSIESAEQGADYVAFGAFFPTQSKPMDKIEKWGIPTVEIIEDWAMATTLPCVAIGGMSPQNCVPLVKAGADFIAAITYVWNHKNGPAAAVKEFAKAIESATV